MDLPRLVVADGTTADAHALFGFSCWAGGDDEPWAQDADDYVRLFALKEANRTLLIRDSDGEIVGVSAFDRRDIRPSGRVVVLGWHLQVVALAVPWRGKFVASELPRCDEVMKASEYVLRHTYQRMLAIDPRRNLVIARVHEDNMASVRACERVDLVRTERSDLDAHWDMLGPVDPGDSAPLVTSTRRSWRAHRPYRRAWLRLTGDPTLHATRRRAAGANAREALTQWRRRRSCAERGRLWSLAVPPVWRAR